MMDFTEVAKQIPALAVLVFLVIFFLKTMKAITARFAETLERNEKRREATDVRREETLRHINDENHKVLSDVRDSLSTNTEALRLVTQEMTAVRFTRHGTGG